MTVGRDVNFRKWNKREKREKRDQTDFFGGGIAGSFKLAPQFQAATGCFKNGPIPTPDQVKCGVRLFVHRSHSIGCGSPRLLVMPNSHGCVVCG